jgi:hypothetical protein
MNLYGSSQAGGVATSLSPGESLTLFDGTESPAAGVTSLAFVRGPSPASDDAGTIFQTAFPTAPTATLLVQGSNIDVEADYETLYTSTSKQFDAYTDTARWKFYRLKLSAYSSGGMPVATVQR